MTQETEKAGTVSAGVHRARRLTRASALLGLAMLTAAAAPPASSAPGKAAISPDQPEPGLPELAAPGPYVPGTMTRTIVAPGQLDASASVAAGQVVRGTRTLPLRIWYPARSVAKARTVTYSASLTAEPPQPPVHFTIAGRAVADGASALELVRRWRPAVVVLDVSMPGMDGWETLAALRSLHPELPVLMCSGYNSVEIEHEGVPFLPKPFTRRGLHEVLCALLED